MSMIAAVVALALAAAETAPSASDKGPMIVTAFDEAVFVPVVPSRPDGPQMAVLRGNPQNGPSDMLLKMKRGAGPLHTHSADYHLTVISGEMKHWDATISEAEAPRLGPGSYWFQPGNKAHADSCLSDECLMFIHWTGKRDGQLATTP